MSTSVSTPTVVSRSFNVPCILVKGRLSEPQTPDDISTGVADGSGTLSATATATKNMPQGMVAFFHVLIEATNRGSVGGKGYVKWSQADLTAACKDMLLQDYCK